LLTIIPVGRRPLRLRPGDVGRAISYAPLIAFAVWLPAAGVQLAARHLLEDRSLLVPVLSLATIAVLTGAMHLDGLADLFDVFGSRRSGEQALAVMRDSRIGAFGAIALVLFLVGDIASLSLAIIRHHGTVALLTSQLAGRLAIVVACRQGSKPARADGLGVQVIGSVSRIRMWITVACVFVAAGIAGKLDYDGGRFRESAHAIFAMLCAVAIAEILRRVAARRLGGITGDVLGALVEVAVFVDLAIMSARAPHWLH
jgi:adenosylcobinamide-GDP ribazoletransferase